MVRDSPTELVGANQYRESERDRRTWLLGAARIVFAKQAVGHPILSTSPGISALAGKWTYRQGCPDRC